MICEMSRLAPVNGYAVKLICELPKEDHDWHWDSTFAVEWREPDPEAKSPSITIRTAEYTHHQPVNV